MRIAGINPTSLFDGVGVNFVVFFQGCQHHCPHCHNPSTWDFNAGVDIPHMKIRRLILKFRPFITGLTLSGGDPVYQLDDALFLARWAKSQRLDVTLYTGFSIDALQSIIVPWDIAPFDYIIDGCFQHDLRDPNIAFRGSRNQKVWAHYSSDTVDVSRILDDA